MNEVSAPYLFTRGQRAIFAEVYFPKKVVYQSEIFSALEDGLEEGRVKQYFGLHLKEILDEMADYPRILDPYQYGRGELVDPYLPTEAEASLRLEQYRSPFYGWSMYEVDGVFKNELTQQLDDERTQIIRLIFRFENLLRVLSVDVGCYDVFEAILRWIMAEHNRLDHVVPWSSEEQERFMKLHGVWPLRKREFVESHYKDIARVSKRWIDDIGLFIYGYLVRRLWTQSVAREQKEDEIWVVSFFNTNLNIVKRQPQKRSVPNGTDATS